MRNMLLTLSLYLGIYLGVTLAICVVDVVSLSAMAAPSSPHQTGPQAGQQAEQAIIFDVAPKNINISADFEGAVVTVFGTILPQKGEGKTTHGPDTPNNPYTAQLAISVRGPQSRVIIRERSSVAGMWLPHDWMAFKDIPLYYDYALSSALQPQANAEFLRQNHIGLNGLELGADDADDAEDAIRFHKFENSLMRLAQKGGMFPYGGREISFLGNGLFRADFTLPNTIPSGDYQVRVSLFQDRSLMAERSEIFAVRQTGFLAAINEAAHRHVMLYAAAGFAIAVLMGLLSAYLSRHRR
ncbi:MAG: TIGR02186 family protein [Alphaproteobacteria bacterium]|nr:TIGR02186 family protein [Alphaproteobacteria bacterium]